jgi:hypothetical protein
MAIVAPGSNNRYYLAPGETLPITTDAASSARYGELATQPVGGVADVPATLVAVPASSTITIGPKATPSRWLIDGVVGNGVTVTQVAAQPVVPQNAAPPDVLHLYGSGAPAAALGQNHAQTGSLYTDTSAGKLYINSGTKSAVSWRIATTA